MGCALRLEVVSASWHDWAADILSKEALCQCCCLLCVGVGLGHELVDRRLELVDLYRHFVDPAEDLLRHLGEFLLHLREDLIHEVREVLWLRRDAVGLLGAHPEIVNIHRAVSPNFVAIANPDRFLCFQSLYSRADSGNSSIAGARV
jgi:hypothetical protein